MIRNVWDIEIIVHPQTSPRPLELLLVTRNATQDKFCVERSTKGRIDP